MPPIAPTDEIVARQAADILDVNVSTIARWVKAGKLHPSRKLPGHTGALLFWRADIERLAANRDEGSAA